MKSLESMPIDAIMTNYTVTDIYFLRLQHCFSKNEFKSIKLFRVDDGHIENRLCYSIDENDELMLKLKYNSFDEYLIRQWRTYIYEKTFVL